jgi:MarR family transcriptional regulator, organic hydroperoxide resistance regulator
MENENPTEDEQRAQPTEEGQREQLGNEIASLMGPLVRSLRGALLTCAGELGLSPSEAQALWLLALRGSLATKDLARALDIDPANASTLVTRLDRRSLVRRHPASHDRRMRLISLTKAGSEMRRRLARCVGERRPSFRELTTDELVTFRDLLRRVASAG